MPHARTCQQSTGMDIIRIQANDEDLADTSRARQARLCVPGVLSSYAYNHIEAGCTLDGAEPPTPRSLE